MIKNITKLIPIIKIKNFPSKDIIIKDFKSYLSEKKSNENYKISFYNNPRNKIYLHLSHSNTAYNLTKNYKKKILTNPLYSKTKCSLFFIKPDDICHLTMDFMKTIRIQKVSNCEKFRKTHREKNMRLNKSCSYQNSYEKKHWADIREKAGIIDNSSPYLDRSDKEYIDKIKNMKKWIIKKDFISTVGKASSLVNSTKKEIKNYVMKTPSLPPVLHQFREIDKRKWVGKKNFFVC